MTHDSTAPERMATAGWTLAAAMGLLLAVAPVGAQEIVGTVRHVTTTAPLSGVLISVLDADGERVRGVLTDEAGGFRVEVPLGRYGLRATRIGLRTETLGPIDVNTFAEHRRDVEMMERPIAIAGLVVDARIQSCRLDERRAVRIQRWWSEIRTALDVSAALQEQSFGEFRVDRFEREWDRDLSSMRAISRSVELTRSSRPFVAMEAARLAARGYVQGDDIGGRDYYAPDAEVLLSGSFLSGHCFSLVEDGPYPDQVGLAFEPVRERAVPDVTGTLWVDTTTAELKRLDFRYVRVPEMDADEAGGRIDFEYLPSGAWIVSDWYIRMPRMGLRQSRRRAMLVLDGYTDVGATVTPLQPGGATVESGSVGAVRGVVFDSIRGRGLADATVSVLGTRYQGTTDAEGRFTLPGVPVGRHMLTFHHEQLSGWGLGSPLFGVEVFEGRTSEARLAVPGFRAVAVGLCTGSGTVAQTVLVGHVLGPDRQPLEDVELQFAWFWPDGGDDSMSAPVSARTGSGGRWVMCSVPAGVRAVARVEREGGRLVEVFEVVTEAEAVVYRQVWLRR